MKVSKKTIMISSFCLGLAMFVTTAFADIVSKTGYEQMKDSIKFSAESFSEKLDSFTTQFTATIKDNDKVLAVNTSTEKIDNKNMMRESTDTQEYADKVLTDYSYRDKESDISKYSSNDTYYVSDYPMQADQKLFPNPFKEDGFSDIEKIIDAVVGNLKDYVVVNEKSDGSREFSGSLTEGQIPALVNAGSSFLFKRTLGTEYRGNSNDDVTIPRLTSDLYIKDVKGKMLVNKDGIAESLLATGVLSGKDKDGVFHDLTLEILVKVLDINSTKITKPSLEGKKVEKHESGIKAEENFISDKLVGKYKNNIVMEKDGKLVKLGERIVEITSAADKHVKGRYYEVYKNEYADYGKDKLDFTFDAESRGYRDAEFKYTTPSGIELNSHISFDMDISQLYFNIPDKQIQSGINFDSRFSRVFDE